MARLLIVSGALLMALAVAFGAAGAHLFKEVLELASYQLYDTAQRYQALHGVGLIVVGRLVAVHPATGWFKLGGGALLVGTLFFCGTLYLRSLGWWEASTPLTPTGGVLLIVGWLGVALGAWRALAPAGTDAAAPVARATARRGHSTHSRYYRGR